MLGGSTAAMVAAASLASAQAQDNGDVEQVVVSASRVTIAGYTAPTPVTVVSAANWRATPRWISATPFATSFGRRLGCA